MKLILYLMNEKGKKCLEKIIDTYGTHIIKCVISNKDNNVKKDFYNEIKNIAQKNKILFFDRNEEYKLNNQKEYFKIAIGWRWIIKDNVNLIVFHDSILPKYRGFSPLVSALINGEKEIGATVLFASSEFDQGDIIAQRKINIVYPIKINDAIKRISEIYQELIIDVISKLLNNNLTGIHQEEKEATYSVWRDDEDYHIDWNMDAQRIVRFIDAVGYPYLGAYSIIGNKMVRIFDAKEVPDVTVVNRTPGKVLFIKNGKPVIICKKGLVQIEMMIDDYTGESFLPLKQYRVRFK